MSPIALMRSIDGQSIAWGSIVHDIDGSQPSGGFRSGDEMLGHAAPAKAGKKKVDTSSQVNKPP